MKQYAEANANYSTNPEAFEAVVEAIYANGYTESEVLDYCLAEGLMD